jgi:AcrR family transcriptional regulator
LAKSVQAVLTPRKLPMQARSVASVDAILDATVQVLMSVGKERLTTTRVAARAGVSVGTLYQYFPNKSALLQSVLTRHLDDVSNAVERVCEEQKGNGLEEMGTCVVNAFLKAKMKNADTSVVMYSVSSDVDGARIAKFKATRNTKAITTMLESSCEPLQDAKLAATMLVGIMVGVSRRLLESESPEKQVEALRREMVFLVCAYLRALRGVAQHSAN